MRKVAWFVIISALIAGTLTAKEWLGDQKVAPGEKSAVPEFAPPQLRSDLLPAPPYTGALEPANSSTPTEYTKPEKQIEQLKAAGLPIPQELAAATGRHNRLDLPRDRSRERQGGDTIAEAVTVPLDTTVTGTTIGYNDDYDEVCPYTGSTSADVVYLLTLAEDTGVILDLCDADYDSKMYVYDEALNLLGCSDDDCGLQSMLVLSVPAGDAYIVVDGYGGQDGAYTLTLSEFIPSGGDFCDDPIPIEELPYSTTGTTIDNTNSYGSSSPDEWYGVEILESGNTLMSMCGDVTDYDSYLRILDGDCVTEIASNDDACGLVSELTVYLEPGDYSICVEGFSSGSGNFSLDVSHSPFTPGQGDFCGDPWIVDAFPYSVSDATTDNIDTFGNTSPDEWYSFDLIEEGLINISLCNGTTLNTFIHLLADDCSTVLATNDYGCGDWGDPSFMVEFLQPGTYLLCVEGYWDNAGDYTLELDFEPFTPGAGDFCDDPHLVPELPFDVTATNLDNIDTYGNDSPDEWYSFEILEEGLVTISLCEGTTFDSFIHLLSGDCTTPLFTDDYSCGTWGDPSYMMRLLQPGTYQLCVEGAWGVIGGDYTLSIEWEEFDPPPGEYCESAIQIPFLPYEAQETTSNNLDTYGNPSPDEWYQFSLPVEGNVLISLCDGGTNYDSYLRLLSEDCNSEIVSNDDACGLQSELDLFLSNGTYMICVEGYSSGSGDYSLDVTTDAPSQGDSCFDPFFIEEFPWSIEWYTFGYSDTGFEPSSDVYYRFLLEEEGIYTFTTCMEETYEGYFDTRLLILAEDCETIIYINDDDCGGAYDNWSTITTCLPQGLYYLVIEGYGTASGNYQLEGFYVGECDPCYPPDCPDWGIAEVEPNNGSNGNPPAYDSIAPGEIHCGGIWSSAYTRDSDWYQFEVEAGTELEFFLDG
ncbi:MAG: PPC domain-containing protein, partial [Candidatus Delongbacteria bacterium]|nr:PPC domain-containing protein [Candidatus Delongbacteria bacterium]